LFIKSKAFFNSVYLKRIWINRRTKRIIINENSVANVNGINEIRQKDDVKDAIIINRNKLSINRFFSLGSFCWIRISKIKYGGNYRC